MVSGGSVLTEQPARKPAHETRELTLLFEISRMLDRSVDLREVVGPVLETLARGMNLSRATLTLFDRGTGEIAIEAAHGLSTRQQARGRYRYGEGVTGRVVETGQPIMVPNIFEEPLFLNRTGVHKRNRGGAVSFICVPILIENNVIGTLGSDRPYDPDRPLDDDSRLLSIVASLIAQAVRLRHAMQEERRSLIEENTRLREELRDRFRPANIIGNSKAMQTVYRLISQVSGSAATVLIRGESGTGKELVAHAIHFNSPRATRPFIRVNCSALPEGMIESELFGHERGAFTGAAARRTGRFELADGGTVFLDEIGDLSPVIQIKLLRFLQEREFERVGGNAVIRTDVRIIAATHVDLEEAVARGRFRSDLYYRLAVFPIFMPPLRERGTDIPLLADHFVDRYARANGRHVTRISTPAIDMLMSYHWPGNVRELENCIERAVLLSDDRVIHSHHLPPSLQTAEASGTGFRGSLESALNVVEREIIIDALKSSRGNMAAAARDLGITERIMGLRVAKFGIDSRRFRPRHTKM